MNASDVARRSSGTANDLSDFREEGPLALQLTVDA